MCRLSLMAGGATGGGDQDDGTKVLLLLQRRALYGCCMRQQSTAVFLCLLYTAVYKQPWFMQEGVGKMTCPKQYSSFYSGKNVRVFRPQKKLEYQYSRFGIRASRPFSAKQYSSLCQPCLSIIIHSQFVSHTLTYNINGIIIREILAVAFVHSCCLVLR